MSMEIKITGTRNLEKWIRSFGGNLSKDCKVAMKKSIAMVETESKKRTPIDTGILKGSIGGAGGFKMVKPFKGKVGTNVRYARFVHEGYARHDRGERKYMEKGAKAAQPFIDKQFSKALNSVASRLK